MKMDAPTFVKNAERLTPVLGNVVGVLHDSEIVEPELVAPGHHVPTGAERPSLVMPENSDRLRAQGCRDLSV